jgi:hypothetical protein
LPPPAAYPKCFQKTHASPLLTEVITDMVRQQLLVPNANIKAAFRLFLIAKSDGSARPVLDLSPWTAYYQLPSMTLYSAAQVLLTIPQGAGLVKVDLTSGFFHFKIQPQHQIYYGIYYEGTRYAFTRLPIGHALAPSIMQRIAQATASQLYQALQLHMCAYLDDWLIWDVKPHHIQPLRNFFNNLGFTINQQKSVFQPTTQLVYLGLTINTLHQQITPTQACINHLRELITIVPQASMQDLRRISGYVAWISWAMSWPQFLATHIRDRSTYWLRVLDEHRLFHQPRAMILPKVRIQLYTDATPTSIAAITPPPTSAFYRRLEPPQPIAVAEMAAALVGLHWYLQDVAHQPTTIILYTDSSIVYHTLAKGTGITLRRSPLLQNLYIAFLINKVYTGHGLVVRWLPSTQNLADPLSRGVHTLQQGTAL